jgi:hypothetical protein
MTKQIGVFRNFAISQLRLIKYPHGCAFLHELQREGGAPKHIFSLGRIEHEARIISRILRMFQRPKYNAVMQPSVLFFWCTDFSVPL